MKTLRIISPSTFFTQDEPVVIYDENGKLFFYHPNKQHKINFNLPIGIFSTDNAIMERPFKPYEQFEKYSFNFSPSTFRPIVKNNPHKATISTQERTIKIDPSIAYNDYLPCKIFIMGHELGHLIVGGSLLDGNGKIIFDAEKACDEISKNYMLSHGYNPSQVKIAAELLLKGDERKQCMHNLTINKKLRR